MKKILKSTFIGVLLLGFVFGIYEVSRPKIEAHIIGEFNPIISRVLLNGKRIPPIGEGGKKILTQASIGSNEFVINGPFIVASSTKINLGPFSKKSLEIEVDERTFDSIVSEAIDASSIEVSSQRVFKDIPCVIAYIRKDGVLENDSYPSLLVYNNEEFTWTDVTQEYIDNRAAIELSVEAKRYYDSLTTD